jgi:2-polyprenyl-6-hydroxyphenyl methylase / 3-demethylubiquinone-9 3-methyltransferase
MINNDFYETLNEGWYTASDHPIALLRAENAIRSPWIANEIQKRFEKPVRVLDVGCGAGFLTNHLALEHHQVTGVDLSRTTLEVAKNHDATKTVHYLFANAYALPFANESFDVVAAMDILEHVDHPIRLIEEASRVLRPEGLFFFHTFNRNLLSYLVIIKGVEWFVRNTPPRMHVYPLFITPKELIDMCQNHHLKVDVLRGFTPKIGSLAFWRLLLTRRISPRFVFTFTRNLLTGYVGFASKQIK